jgi:TolA-binding protein
MAILREMVVREPVESMFDVLEQGDLTRITEMLSVKHGIDTLWKGVDTLIGSVMRTAGLSTEVVHPQGGFDEEFFNILQANLGQQSEIYYRKLNDIKDSLVNRGTGANIKDMFSVETFRIRKYAKENKTLPAQRKIAEVTARYKGRIAMEDLAVLDARISLARGDFSAALASLAGLPPEEAENNRAQLRHLYRMQSLYALHVYDSVWQEGVALEYSRFSGASRNLLIWITMESGLALGRKDSYLRLASYIDRKAPYALHIMHALGQSYVAGGDLTMALSVFESASKYTERSGMDRAAARELSFACAGAYYELGRYDKAMNVFYELLNDNSGFDRALYGILWCYIQLGQNDKAETTMRKLINQSPESSYAADAFLVFAKRYMYKAHYEWKKIGYLTKEEARLKEMAAKLEEKRKADTSARRDTLYAGAKKELDGLFSRLKAEPRASYDTLAGYYGSIQRICGLIADFYATGSFQKVTFTEKREQLLHYLDSVILGAKESGSTGAEEGTMVSNRRQEISAIKAIVARATIFSTEAQLERYRFDREYINWQKSQLNYYEEAALRPYLKKSDSASVAYCAAQKNHYSRLLDSLVSVEDNLKQQSTGRLKTKLQRLIATMDKNSADAAFFNYHFGELCYAQENADFSQEYDRYEKDRTRYEEQLAAFRDNKLLELPLEPKLPKIDHSASMAAYGTALALAPVSASDCIAAIHYSIAWCWNDAGQFDSALAHMQTVATGFPKSAYASQAWLYSGEYMFDKGNLPRAIQCYQAVMKYPESEWFDDALYKLAWSQYRQSNPEKAISTFLALVDLGGGRGKGMQMLEKESMDYIAISFSEADMTGEKGLERATAFAKKLGSPDRGSEILHRLAKVYRDQGRYELAKKTYRLLMRLNPTYPNMPNVEFELLSAIEHDAPPDESNSRKVEFFSKYNSRSSWSGKQTDPEAVQRADSMAQRQLYDAALGYHQMALQKNDTMSYNLAISVYTDFIRAYPKSKLASECHYNLAEIEFSKGDYIKATEDYITVSKRYPDSKFRETAAWNAIVSSQNLLKSEDVQR